MLAILQEFSTWCRSSRVLNGLKGILRSMSCFKDADSELPTDGRSKEDENIPCYIVDKAVDSCEEPTSDKQYSTDTTASIENSLVEVTHPNDQHAMRLTRPLSAYRYHRVSYQQFREIILRNWSAHQPRRAGQTLHQTRGRSYAPIVRGFLLKRRGKHTDNYGGDHRGNCLTTVNRRLNAISLKP